VTGPRDLALIGVSVALALVLGMLPVMHLPFGGRISLEYVPLVVLALLRGPAAGALAGAVEGILHFQVEPFLLTPLSLVLDYPLPRAAMGLAGLGRPVVGITVAFLAALALHSLSGYLYFAGARVGWAAWTYAVGYNSLYLVPSWIAALVLAPLMARRMARPRR